MNQILQKFLDATRGDKLFFFEGAYAPINFVFSWNNYPLYAKFYETPGLQGFFVIQQREAKFIFSETRYVNYAKEIFIDYWQGGGKWFEYERQAVLMRPQIEHWYNEQILKDLTQVSDEELIQMYRAGTNYFTELVARTIWVEYFDDRVVREVLGEKAEALLGKVWDKATFPHFEAFETRRFWQAADFLEKNIPNKERLFRYASTDYFSVHEITETEAYFRDLTPERRAEFTERKLSQEKEFAEYTVWLETLSPEERKLAEYVQRIMNIRDWRKDPLAQEQTLCFLSVEEMLRRCRIDPAAAPYITEKDINAGLDVLRTHKDEIERRKDGFIAAIDEEVSSETLDVTDILKELHDFHIGQENSSQEVREILGQVGSRGKATGRVRLVRDIRSVTHLESDEILVTGMTRPEFLPLMQQAVAFVTDEGGITCHAAIVAREMRKPCIIGARIATKILHDGDLVEVDAEKGVVRILERGLV